MPVLRERLAHLLMLRTFDVGTRTGPALWLRCMMARTLPEGKWTEKVIPMIYLPGVSRQELRAVAECPAPLIPLGIAATSDCRFATGPPWAQWTSVPPA